VLVWARGERGEGRAGQCAAGAAVCEYQLEVEGGFVLIMVYGVLAD